MEANEGAAFALRYPLGGTRRCLKTSQDKTHMRSLCPYAALLEDALGLALLAWLCLGTSGTRGWGRQKLRPCEPITRQLQ